MHPALQAQNLSKLPPSLRICATKVFANVSYKNIQAYLKMFLTLNLGQTFLLLPVFFAHLKVPEDCNNIETTMDDKGTHNTPQAQAAFLAVEGLRVLAINGLLDGDIFYALWPRLFAWLEIQERHARLHPHGNTRINIDVRLSALTFVPIMVTYPEVHALASETPRARRLFTIAWHVLLYDQPTQVHPEYKLAMGHVLGRFMKPTDETNLEEIVGGAGGSLSDLAELLVRSIINGGSRLITSPEAAAENFATEEFDRAFVDGILEFMSQALCCRPLLRDALLEAEFMEALVKDIVASSICSADRTRVSHSIAFKFIAESLEMEARPDLMCAAIRGQLLTAIVTSASRGPIVGGFRDKIIRDILPGYLAYYSVLATVQSDLNPETEELLNDFLGLHWVRETPFAEFWHSWRKLAEERFDVLKSWADQGYISVVMCENMKCGTKSERKQDWKDGHRHSCSEFRDSEPGRTIWKYNLVFLRMVIDHDRESFLGSVSIKGVNNPSTVYLEIDYRHGAARITSRPIEEYIPVTPFLQLQWQDLRTRMARGSVEQRVG
ncbi:hypothetical protein B0H19DRAFT_1243466, partial [Mycena capillaripes]